MSVINPVTTLEMDGDIAVIILNSPPVNALSEIMREGLISALARADADAGVRAILVICAGRTFIAGADIAEFDKVQTGASLRDVQDAFDAVRKPVVMGLHGTILGGGLETAMCGHYRVAVPSAKMGQPEVALGLVPGAGGTQRLPRLVGVPAALKMVTDGKPVSAAEALKLGLIDALLPEGDVRPDDLKIAALEYARVERPVRRTRDMNDKVTGIAPAIFEDFRKAHDFGGFEAPGDAVACVEAATRMPFDEGLEFERVIFEARKASAQSLAMRYAFFAERKAGKGVGDDVPILPIKNVGVVGAGFMGSNIAQVFANAGLNVILVEADDAALARGLDSIAKAYATAVARGRMKQDDADTRRGRIKPSTKLDDMAACDLVVEAVFERMDVKKQVMAKLDAVLRPDAIIASNTSFLDLNEIAAATTRPERVVGLHFFSPAAIMRLVEVVRGDATSASVLATALKLTKTIGKLGVVVGAGPGFVGNRMLLARQRQADWLVLEGASPFAVDRVMTDFGFPMGPFALADLAGLDLFWDAAHSKGESLRDLLCEAGRKGQKTGAGYYDYDDKRKATPSPLTEKMLADLRSAKDIKPRVISDSEILERCLYPLINEGAKILEEGKAARASDIDVIWLTGFGWPLYRGGPMYHAGVIGLDKVGETLRKYGIEPAALLDSPSGLRNFA